jgi:uncharacterized protein YjbI with pentapeptide repeats
MATKEHVMKLREGSVAWNQWRWNNPSLTPDLSGETIGRAPLSKLNLARTLLNGTRFIHSTLVQADFSDADLTGATFIQASLVRAKFDQARMYEARFHNCLLNGATMSGAMLFYTSFDFVDFNDVDVSFAEMGGTKIAGSDLSRLKGCELVLHQGPSVIALDTYIYPPGRFRGRSLRVVEYPTHSLISSHH